METPLLRRHEVEYPESDGKPMAETDVHRDLMLYLIDALRRRFVEHPAFYASGNLFVYYEEGDVHKFVAPDFFVVRGVPKRWRRIFKVWEEKKGPDIVIELTSQSTDVEDRGNKRAIYEELGVKEYFIFDPEAARTRLTGFRLQDGYFQHLAPSRAAGDLTVYASEVLELELHGHGRELRWVDPSTGQPLTVPREAYEQAKEAVERAELEQRRAEREKERADREKERADHEKERAERLEAELRKLRDG